MAQSAHLYKRVAIPDIFLNETEGKAWGGDIRIGDLTGDGTVDLLVYKSLGGIHPCFLGAFTLAGEPIWSFGDKHLEIRDADVPRTHFLPRSPLTDQVPLLFTTSMQMDRQRLSVSG